MLENSEINEIEERAKAASPGPWNIGFNGSMRSGWAIQRAGTASPILHLDADKNIALDIENHSLDGTLDFIQNSREDVPLLIQTIRELKAAEVPPEAQSLAAEQELQLTVAKLASQVERLKAVLYFYAHPDTYRQKPADPEGKAPEWIGTDLGARARKAFEPEPV